MMNFKVIFGLLVAAFAGAATTRYVAMDAANLKGQASISTAQSGYYNLGIKSGDSKVYVKDSSGTETALQYVDPELTALAGLTSAADKIPYFTGSGTAGLVTIGSGISFSGGILSAAPSAPTYNAKIISGAYTLTNSDDIIFYNCSTPCVQTVHAASGASAKWYTAMNIGIAPVTFVPAGSDTLSGDTQVVLAPGQAGVPRPYFQLFPYGGSNTWHVFAH